MPSHTPKERAKKKLRLSTGAALTVAEKRRLSTGAALTAAEKRRKKRKR